jgi:hypothetical protein
MARLTALALLAIGFGGCSNSHSAAITAPTPVAVAPPPSAAEGQVQVKGTVSDAVFRQLAGVRIEVLDGPQTGTSTLTNAAGKFAFSGTFDDHIRFRATKEGYVSSIRASTFCAACIPNRWVNFSLDSLGGAVDMSGEYQMTLRGTCASLPEEVRTRTYEISVGPEQQQSVRVRGASFVDGWDRLPMGISSDYVAFWIEVLVEQVAPNTYLTVNALAAAHVDTPQKQTFTFPLDGFINYCVTAPDSGTYLDCYRGQAVKRIDCAAGQLLLTRR